MRQFKKSIVLGPRSPLVGEYAVMSKCDGLFVSLSSRRGRLVVRDSERKVLFTFETNIDLTFFVYADMIGERFFAYDSSLDGNFFERHAALVAAVAGDQRIAVVYPLFTKTPREHLHLAPAIDAPCDGVVLVSVDDATPHYKWKAVHTADFLVTSDKKCLVGWLASDPFPFDWCEPERRIGSSYIGIAFGDASGPHRFEGETLPETVVECRFKHPNIWVWTRDRVDKTQQYVSSRAMFAGANSWKTVLSVVELSTL